MTPPSGSRPGRRLVVEADGGSRGNPGVAGYGALVRDPATGVVLVELAEPLGRASNNVAEYSGLLAGLQAAAEIDPGARVEVRLDSKLVVEQMTGRWKIKHEDMRRLALEARDVCDGIRAHGGSVEFTWVPRESNKDADALSNEAMDGHSVRRVHDDSAASTDATASEDATGPETEPQVGSERRDLRLVLVQATDDEALTGRVATALTRLAGPTPRIVTGSDRAVARTAELVARALGVGVEVAEGWNADPGRSGTEPRDGGSAAAYGQLRHEGGTVVVVTTRRGICTVLAEVLGLAPERFWAVATAPGSLTGIEVWADGQASIAFTNRTDHLG